MEKERRLTIDSISFGIARLETPDRAIIEIPSSQIPASAKEGDVLELTVGEDPIDPAARFRIDAEATDERIGRIRSKLDRIRRTRGS